MRGRGLSSGWQAVGARCLVVACAVALALLPSVTSGAVGTDRLDWGSKPPIPAPGPRSGVAVAPNGKLYAIGGVSGGSGSALQEYDPATNTWATKPPMPTARGGLGLAAAPNGKLYAVGGSNAGLLGTVEEYDPATNTWTNCGQPAPGNACASMPTARSELGLAAAPNGKLYAVGGDAGGPVNVVQEYDPAANTWTNCGQPAPGNACAPMLAPRSRLGVAAAPNGKLYAVGGDGGSTQVDEYDPATNTWTSKAPLSTARIALGLAAAPNGKLYAVGGLNAAAGQPGCPDRTCATVEEYDPATNTWTLRAPMPTARYALGLATAPNGKLYAVGGADQIPPFFVEVFVAAVEEYDPAANSWASALAPSKINYPPRHAAAVTAANGRIYVFGGDDKTTNYKTTFEYTPATDTWRQLNDMPTPRYGMAAALATNGKIYVVGGYNGNLGGYLNTVEEFDPAGAGGQGDCKKWFRQVMTR